MNFILNKSDANHKKVIIFRPMWFVSYIVGIILLGIVLFYLPLSTETLSFQQRLTSQELLFFFIAVVILFFLVPLGNRIIISHNLLEGTVRIVRMGQLFSRRIDFVKDDKPFLKLTRYFAKRYILKVRSIDGSKTVEIRFLRVGVSYYKIFTEDQAEKLSTILQLPLEKNL